MYIIDKSLETAHKLLPQIIDGKINRNWHFAFAYKKNKLLSIGFNDMTTESSTALKFARKFNIIKKYNFVHAEIDMLRRMWGKHHVDHRIRVVVIRLNRFHQLGDSKPCSRFCYPILTALGVNEIYWSNQTGKFSGICDDKVLELSK